MRNALLFAGSLLLSLLLAEVVLHILHPFDRMQTWIEMADRGYVMNRAGGSAIHELDGEAVNYTFDADRFRISDGDARDGQRAGTPGEDGPAQRPTPTTILMGDSYAFGLYLPDSATLANRMGWRNFAVGGAGPADYLAQLRDFLPRWENVDTVLVLLSIDDATRTLGKDLFRLDGESQRWRPSGFRRFMEALPGYHPLQKHSYLLNGFIRLAWPRWYFDELSTPDILVDSLYVAQIHTKIFAEMRDLCARKGCELVLASNGFWRFQTVDRNQNWLMRAMPAIAAEIGVKYVDCGDVILGGEPSKDLSELALPTDPHPSAQGVKAMAGCLR